MANPPVADLLRLLLQTGNDRGLSMRPSAELSAYLKSGENQRPNLESFTSNVEQFPAAPFTPEASSTISNDPFFNEQALQHNEQVNTLMDIVADRGRIPGPAAPGKFFIWAQDSQGRRTRLDGPFNSEIEAQREMRSLREEWASANRGKVPNLYIGTEEILKPK